MAKRVRKDAQMDDTDATLLDGDASGAQLDPAPDEQIVVRPMHFGPLRPQSPDSDVAGNLEMLLDVGMRVTVELGRTNMSIRKILALTRGSVIELNKLAGEPVDVFVNDTLIAHGEVVVVGEKFGVRVTELVNVARGLSLAGLSR